MYSCGWGRQVLCMPVLVQLAKLFTMHVLVIAFPVDCLDGRKHSRISISVSR